MSCPLSASGDNSLERAFDGDAKTFFWTDGAPGEGELLRIHFCAPRKVKHIRVISGDAEKPQDFIHEGTLDIAARETSLQMIAAFKDGVADREFPEETIDSIRIRLTKAQDNWVRIREIIVE